MPDYTKMMPPSVRAAWSECEVWAEGEGLRVRVSRPKDKPRKRREVATIEPDDYDRLMRSIDKRAVTQVRSRALIALLYHTGLRIGEALALKVDDIEIDGEIGKVHVPCEDGCKTGARTVAFCAERGGNPTQVAVEVNRWLAVRFPVGEYLFNTSTGAQLADQAVRRSLGVYGRRAGVKVTPHMFRHTYATRLMRNGADLAAVQMLLGHADASTTAEYYLHADERRMVEVVVKYGA